MNDLRTGDYFRIAATPRFRASRRRRIRESSRQGMIIAAGVALLGSVWHVPFHPEAAGLILGLNAMVALVALGGYVAIATVARRRPEAVVFLVLVAVDAACIAIGLGHPPLGLVAIGYLLLLPVIVSLVIAWGTPIHVAWLGLHGALALAYAMFAPSASLPGGAREQLVALLVVALAVSQAGHVASLRGRVVSFRQIEQIKALNRQARRDQDRLDRLVVALADAAATDALTGLGNRSALTAGLHFARSRIERQGDRYGLLILDLDRFKGINDERGHGDGDEVLRAASGAIRRALRPGDTAYRYGGEEFVVLVRLARPSEALAVAERIRRAIEDLQIPNAANTPYSHLTTSVGVVSIGPDDLAGDDESWLARADAALYRAKANGRNRSEPGP